MCLSSVLYTGECEALASTIDAALFPDAAALAVCLDMHIDMCIDMHADVYMDMYIDMR